MDTIMAIIMFIISIAVPYKDTGSLDWDSRTPLISMSGCAAYYSDGLMESVAEYWGFIDDDGDYDSWLESSGYVGAVAVYRKLDKGRTVHILWPDGTLDGPYIAIETVAKHHYDLGISRNRVIDVDYSTAERMDMRGPVAVTIMYDMPFDTPGAIESWSIDKYGGCLGN